MIYILILCYNEESALPGMLSNLRKILGEKKEPYRVVVVNDGSVDGTAAAMEALAKEHPLIGLHHEVNQGVAKAFNTGIRHIAQAGSESDVVITMEGDGTNDVACLPSLVDRLREGFDVVCASRYCPGGSYVGFPLKRYILSVSANFLTGLVFGVPGVRDYTIFFRGYRVGILKRTIAAFGEDFIQSRGFASNAEMLLKASRSGPLRCAEVPTIYRYDLKRGKSKMKIFRNAAEYFLMFTRTLRSRAAKASSKDGLALVWLAAASALTLTLLRMPLTASDHLLLLTKARLLDTSLSLDPLLRATLSAPYSAAPALFSTLCSHLSAFFHVPPEFPISALMIALWTAQALLMFRLAKSATGRDDAALLATTFFGLDMPLFLVDAPSQISYFERSLGMVPLLYALIALIEGRRWAAWACCILSMYLHASPALYFLPLMALEEGLTLWKKPEETRTVLTRLASAAAACSPLFYRVATTVQPPGQEAFYRISLMLHSPASAGTDTAMVDHLYRIEAACLTALAAFRCRRLPSAHLIAHGVAVGLLLLGLGTASYLAFIHGNPLWGIFIKMHLWKALYLLEIAGLFYLSTWMAEMFEDPKAVELWPAMMMILALSAQRDPIMRFSAVLLGICMISGATRTAIAVGLGFAALPLTYAWMPSLYRTFLLHTGLHGGFLSLPSFKPFMGWAWIAALACGQILRTISGSRTTRLYAAAAVAMTMMVLAQSYRTQTVGWMSASPRQMAAWLSQNTPKDSAIIASPMDLIGSCKTFMRDSERSISPCQDYYEGLQLYGTFAAPMARRLSALGLDLGRIVSRDDLRAEPIRAHRDLDPRMVLAAAKEFGADYFLTSPGGRWPWPMVHGEEGLALYHLATMKTTPPQP